LFTALETRLTNPTTDQVVDCNSVSEFEPLDMRSDRRDCARHFVPGSQRKAGHLAGTCSVVDVRTADAGGFDSHLDVVGPDPGNFNVFLDQRLARFDQAYCSHGSKARELG